MPITFVSFKLFQKKMCIVPFFVEGYQQIRARLPVTTLCSFPPFSFTLSSSFSLSPTHSLSDAHSHSLSLTLGLTHGLFVLTHERTRAHTRTHSTWTDKRSGDSVGIQLGAAVPGVLWHSAREQWYDPLPCKRTYTHTRKHTYYFILCQNLLHLQFPSDLW